jgi:hypothetical protein
MSLADEIGEKPDSRINKECRSGIVPSSPSKSLSRLNDARIWRSKKRRALEVKTSTWPDYFGHPGPLAVKALF